ncbi:MAG TPA: 3-phosphoshikimate 1-carboxyvinyltransferase [Pyrinomonadaceae bacterium]|nr:3-phosphoshikimate 1-carboxyvinyltransferase [Pyrinomonadaceae bacterium]
MLIRPARAIKGEISLPGDKSISHRAAIFAAMATGESRIENFATSADCASTLKCLRQVGVEVRQEGPAVRIQGVGKSGFVEPAEPLDCGNSGTTMRLLAGVLAGQSFESVLTGDDSLQKRPMGRVIDPLTAMGASFESENNRAPLRVLGRNPLRAIEYQLPVASAQIKSCMLLAGLNSDGETAVIEPVPTRDHTERMLRWFGVDVLETNLAGGKRISVTGTAQLTAADVVVPSDISSAAFFLVLALSLANSDLRIRNVGSNPTRAAIVETLRNLGADIRTSNERELNNEPMADIHILGGMGQNSNPVIKGKVIANLVDELPILAILGTQLQNGLEVRDAAELRVKETDRIAAVVENLRRMNADVEEFDDGFRVGKSDLKGARVDSFGDHRIAMAFAVAGLLATEGETEIVGAESVDVSFPGFFEVLHDVVVYE